MSERDTRWLGAGAVVTAIGASLCCILPVAVALLGVGSAALAAELEPLRPWMTGATILILGFAFYRSHRPARCEPGGTCIVPASRRRQRVALWLASLVALALLTFPYYSSWLL